MPTLFCVGIGAGNKLISVCLCLCSGRCSPGYRDFPALAPDGWQAARWCAAPSAAASCGTSDHYSASVDSASVADCVAAVAAAGAPQDEAADFAAAREHSYWVSYPGAHSSWVCWSSDESHPAALVAPDGALYLAVVERRALAAVDRYWAASAKVADADSPESPAVLACSALAENFVVLAIAGQAASAKAADADSLETPAVLACSAPAENCSALALAAPAAPAKAAGADSLGIPAAPACSELVENSAAPASAAQAVPAKAAGVDLPETPALAVYSERAVQQDLLAVVPSSR